MNVTLRDVVQLYQFFCENADFNNADNVKNAVVELSQVKNENGIDQNRELIREANRCMAVAVNAIKHSYREQATSDLLKRIVGISNENRGFAELMKHVGAVARKYFPNSTHVEPVLSGKIFRGCTTLYSLVMKNPDYQYTHPFIMQFPQGLINLLKSFDGGVPRNIGIHALKGLVVKLEKHRKDVLDLDPDNADLQFFVDQMIGLKGNDDAQDQFYEQIKSCMKAEAMGLECSILEHIDTEAAKLVDRESVEEGVSGLAQMRAQGFAHQKNHGGGAFISGRYGLRGNSSGQFFGDGILDNGSSQKLNAFSDVSLDAADESLRERLKQFGRKIVENFYQRGELLQYRLHVIGKVLKEIPLDDPIDQARITVGALIRHKLQEYPKKNNLMFDLDIAEKERLAPQFAKEIILYGIQNRIFSVQQGAYLIRAYRLNADPDIVRASLEAIQSLAPQDEEKKE
ncbi:MAG: hypothetical protein K1X28_10070 [Parachlamydiales bacterium]|nr:hypothetical protein [Parachlamydiales bacterium]